MEVNTESVAEIIQTPGPCLDTLLQFGTAFLILPNMLGMNCFRLAVSLC